MLSKHVRTSVFYAVAVAALLLSACGGGGDDADPAPPPSQSPPPPPAVTLAEAYTDLVAGTSTSPQGWPAWTAPTGHPAVGGVNCVSSEVYHLHALVSIYKNGVRQGLPEDVGRNGCTYELHTHDVTGVVHIETNVAKKFTLGQFFALWNQPLGANGTAGLPGPIGFYLIENDKLTPLAGDPAQLELGAHREIVITSGPPPATLPKYRWPSGL
jgi:hypothetical protein